MVRATERASKLIFFMFLVQVSPLLEMNIPVCLYFVIVVNSTYFSQDICIRIYIKLDVESINFQCCKINICCCVVSHSSHEQKNPLSQWTGCCFLCRPSTWFILIRFPTFATMLSSDRARSPCMLTNTSVTWIFLMISWVSAHWFPS